MAIHQNIPSMLQESLPEMLLVAKYCIKFRKDTNVWPAPGCYGYPAALLLLSIVDSIGSYVERGSVKNHFKVLNNADYYGLNLNNNELRVIYDKYRNLLSHNTALAPNAWLNIGNVNDPVLQDKNGLYVLNLVPFYAVNAKAVAVLLNNPEVLKNNQTIENISKKSR